MKKISGCERYCAAGDGRVAWREKEQTGEWMEVRERGGGERVGQRDREAERIREKREREWDECLIHLCYTK